MHFTRRRFLAVAAAALLLPLLAWWPRRKAPAPSTAMAPESLRTWVDTLLPAEPDFPGGLVLGVTERIAATLERDPGYAKLAREAATWLDARARAAGGTAFAELPETLRNDVVAAAAASAQGSTPRTFFQASLDDALFHAYADPRAWAGLNYAGPPQPIGFPDHAAAPKAD